jgi:hypothetical protein
MKTPLLLLALTLLALPDPAAAQAGNPWFAEDILQAPDKLGGCAVGDLDADHPGNEVVAVCATGEVFVARPYGKRWVAERMLQLPGEMIQCAIGDADPARAGNELVAVGMASGTEDSGGAGRAVLLWRGAAGWETRTLLDDDALLHACAVTDLDPGRPGNEVVLGGFSKKLWMLSGGGAEREVVATLPGPIKSIVPFQGGVAVACADGSLLHFARRAEGSGWTTRVLQLADAGQARLGASGDALLTARDDGELVLFRGENEPATIHRERSKLRGAVLADLDPEHPGLEAATGGYANRLTVLYQEDGIWYGETVFTDTDRFHHLAWGELYEASPGPEVVACGYSGRLILAGVEVHGPSATEDRGADGEERALAPRKRRD